MLTLERETVGVKKEIGFFEWLGLEWASFTKHPLIVRRPREQGAVVYNFPEEPCVAVDLNKIIREMEAVWFTRRDYNSRLSAKTIKEKRVFRNGVEEHEHGIDILRGTVRDLNREKHPIIGRFSIWDNPHNSSEIRRVDLYLEATPIKPSNYTSIVEGIGLSFSEGRRSFGERFPREYFSGYLRSYITERQAERQMEIKTESSPKLQNILDQRGYRA